MTPSEMFTLVVVLATILLFTVAITAGIDFYHALDVAQRACAAK